MLKNFTFLKYIFAHHFHVGLQCPVRVIWKFKQINYIRWNWKGILQQSAVNFVTDSVYYSFELLFMMRGSVYLPSWDTMDGLFMCPQERTFRIFGKDVSHLLWTMLHHTTIVSVTYKFLGLNWWYARGLPTFRPSFSVSRSSFPTSLPYSEYIYIAKEPISGSSRTGYFL